MGRPLLTSQSILGHSLGGTLNYYKKQKKSMWLGRWHYEQANTQDVNSCEQNTLSGTGRKSRQH